MFEKKIDNLKLIIFSSEEISMNIFKRTAKEFNILINQTHIIRKLF